MVPLSLGCRFPFTPPSLLLHLERSRAVCRALRLPNRKKTRRDRTMRGRTTKRTYISTGYCCRTAVECISVGCWGTFSDVLARHAFVPRLPWWRSCSSRQFLLFSRRLASPSLHGSSIFLRVALLCFRVSCGVTVLEVIHAQCKQAFTNCPFRCPCAL